MGRVCAGAIFLVFGGFLFFFFFWSMIHHHSALDPVSGVWCLCHVNVMFLVGLDGELVESIED